MTPYQTLKFSNKYSNIQSTFQYWRYVNVTLNVMPIIVILYMYGKRYTFYCHKNNPQNYKFQTPRLQYMKIFTGFGVRLGG